MKTHAGGFPGSKKAVKTFPVTLRIPTTAIDIRLDPTHLIMHARTDGQWLLNQIHVGKGFGFLMNLPQSLLNDLSTQMPAVL